MLAKAAGNYRRVAQRDAGPSQASGAPASPDAASPPGATCDTCGGSAACLNPTVRCARCRGTLCRRCFHPACAVELGGVVASLPQWLSRRAVCEACAPDAAREDRFRTLYLHALVRGELARREAVSYFSDSAQQVWVSLDASSGAVAWRSLALEMNRPKDSGAVPLHAVAAVSAVSADAGGRRAGALLALPTGGASPPPERPQASPLGAPPLSVRLADARGRQRLQLGFADARAARRWIEGLTEAVALVRLPHGGVFGVAAAAAGGGRGDVAMGAARDGGGSAGAGVRGAGAPIVRASDAAREARARDREVFRASLGTVGMANTAAAAMRVRDGGGRRGAGAAAPAPPAGGDAAAGAGGAAGMSVDEERAVNADIDDAVDAMVRRTAVPAARGGGAAPVGASAAGAGGSGRWGSNAGGAVPPASRGGGAAAPAPLAVRTGSLEADRAINAALTGAKSLGALAAGWVARATARPAPAGGSGRPPGAAVGRGTAHPPTGDGGVRGLATTVG